MADFRMVHEARKQSIAWMETDYSKHTHFLWKIKWRLEHLGTLGIMGDMAPFKTEICLRGLGARGGQCPRAPTANDEQRSKTALGM